MDPTLHFGSSSALPVVFVGTSDYQKPVVFGFPQTQPALRTRSIDHIHHSSIGSGGSLRSSRTLSKIVETNPYAALGSCAALIAEKNATPGMTLEDVYERKIYQETQKLR